MSIITNPTIGVQFDSEAGQSVNLFVPVIVGRYSTFRFNQVHLVISTIDYSVRVLAIYQLHHLCTLSLRKMLYEEVIAAFKRAFEINPQHLIVLDFQALTFSFLKDFRNALAAINKAINLEPQEALYKANHGIILARAGRYP